MLVFYIDPADFFSLLLIPLSTLARSLAYLPNMKKLAISRVNVIENGE